MQALERYQPLRHARAGEVETSDDLEIQEVLHRHTAPENEQVIT